MDSITRRAALKLLAVTAEAGAVTSALAEEAVVVVHKDPSCGCCTGWAQHMRQAGFAVRLDETSNLEAVRARLGVPSDLTACHTAEVSGYVIEGHVPAAAVRRLLSERPAAKGLAVPGMPAGSPGMEVAKPQSYTVVLFGPDGHRPFMRFKGAVETEG